MKTKRIGFLALAIILLISAIPMSVAAAETKWNMGSVVNTGKDNGIIL